MADPEIGVAAMMSLWKMSAVPGSSVRSVILIDRDATALQELAATTGDSAFPIRLAVSTMPQGPRPGKKISAPAKSTTPVLDHGHDEPASETTGRHSVPRCRGGIG